MRTLSPYYNTKTCGRTPGVKCVRLRLANPGVDRLASAREPLTSAREPLASTADSVSFETEAADR
eukprot:4212219-Pyramimonas_sp.AAC.1